MLFDSIKSPYIRFAVQVAVFAATTAFAGSAVNRREVFKYDVPDKSPVWFGGESRCEGVDEAGEYSIYIDIYFADGSNAWALQAMFPRGTHDWVRREVLYIPPKPVSRIHLYRMLRKASGTAEFRDVFLKREKPSEGHVLCERRFSMRPYRNADRTERMVMRKGKAVREFVEERDASAAARVTAMSVWTADSMVKISPAAIPTPEQLASRSIRLELAGGESESVQVCVTAPEGQAAETITVAAGRLSSANGDTFPGVVDVRRVGYLARLDGFEVHPFGDDPDELWFPEPLLPAEGMRTMPGGTQSAWLTFKSARGAKPGIYSGKIAVRIGSSSVDVPVSIRVRGFSLPVRFGLKTAYSVMDGFTRAVYPDDFAAKKRESWDIMLDHRLNPTDISRTTPPDIADIEYAVKRGMNSFNVLNLVWPNPKAKWGCRPKPGDTVSAEFRAYLDRTLKPYVAELRRRGLDRDAYLYGYDECGKEYYKEIGSLCPYLKSTYGLPLMTTAYMFRDVARHRIDFGSPEAMMTDRHCPHLEDYDPLLADRYRACGKEVWWYTSCHPHPPYPNNAPYSYPLIECRLLGWLTKLVRADGFLYWHVNYWRTPNRMDERETYFPVWRTDTFPKAHGDGVFLYPGREHVLSGIRLANVRDGEEDYEWLQLAAERVGRNAVEAAIREVARSTTDFSRDPGTLRRARELIGDMIEGAVR